MGMRQTRGRDRNTIILYINGERHEVGGEQVFLPVTDYLRYGIGRTGTKVVCAEGDCGACTVLLGRLGNGEIGYKPVNACIQYIYQLDGMHLITVEGLKINGELNPVQEAMITCHGAQCGYCTPGMVVAMCGLMQENLCSQAPRPATSQEVREALTGNLCRCTGYESILNAGAAVNPVEMPSLQALYPSVEMAGELEKCAGETVCIEADDRLFLNPVSIEEAVGFKAEYPNLTIINGGTDVSVFCNKRGFEPPVLMSLSKLPDLDRVEILDGWISVGARASLVQLERSIEDIYPELHRMLNVFGSPQIKHAGTLSGNIANGSPIGDTLPFLFVTDSEVEVTGVSGTRRISMNHLYTGYKTLDMRPDEMITCVWIPMPRPDETLRLYKVSRRKHLDISTFTAAVRMQKSGDDIEDIRIAYGGVGPTVLRLPKTEAFLNGSRFSEANFREAGKIARSEITPISDVRGLQDYRFQLAENILLKFYTELKITGQEVRV